MHPSALPVFTHPGDVRSEVDRIVAGLGGAQPAGLHRSLFVTRAGSTVVIVTGRDVPLAEALRAHTGWAEPVEPRP